jgi:hypothetical protein
MASLLILSEKSFIENALSPTWIRMTLLEYRE